MGTQKNKVFISYSWKDSNVANKIKESISDKYEVWIDKDRVKIGDNISNSIIDGLKGSDYYLIIISESSMQSNWVRKELSMAFELSNTKMLSIVPVLIEDAELPLELHGLLYLDLRKSFSAGIEALKEFFASQVSKIGDVEPRQVMLKSMSDEIQQRNRCNEALRDLSLGALRERITRHLGLGQIEVIWFDLFDRKMKDEVRIEDLAQSSVELIDRSRREDKIVYLIDNLCRNFPIIIKNHV